MKPSEADATSPANPWRAKEFWRKRGSWVMLSLVAISLGLVAWRPAHPTLPHEAVSPRSRTVSAPTGQAIPVGPPAKVWLVETRDGFENYSNGLRIDDKYAVANEPRERYPIYGYPNAGKDIVEWKTTPAGIVFHTTESHLAPFEPAENRHLMRLGAGVLE